MTRRSPAAGARGFSLVEVLVALVVLSVGLLGIAGLYIDSMRSGRVATSRSQAVALAASMADLIRANRAGAATYDDANSGAGAANAGCLQGGAGCAPDAMASFDKYRWNQDIAASLPSGTGTVTVDQATVPWTYTLTITWVEPSLGPDADQLYVLSFQT